MELRSQALLIFNFIALTLVAASPSRWRLYNRVICYQRERERETILVTPMHIKRGGKGIEQISIFIFYFFITANY